MQLPDEPERPLEINVVPLIDVMFALLTFFIIEEQLPWLRWWDSLGNLLLTGVERAEAERQRAEKAEQENARLREQLRALGVDPDVRT